jgi:hypothetical protein
VEPRPDLDDACGEFFTYRDLTECGETWARLAEEGRRVENVPLELETLDAMRTLCRIVLDPLAEKFGRPELSYAFGSPSLTKQIRGRISPLLDQHAGSERNQRGQLICRRRGFAVDLQVPGARSREVATWVIEHLDFDRLYFYSDERPFHVSVGPEQSRSVVVMLPTTAGRLVPRSVTKL